MSAEQEEELIDCLPDQFKCGSVPRERVASGESSESGGDSPAGWECVPITWRCDGRPDCTDGSDEGPHCEAVIRGSNCTSSQFACPDGSCVPAAARCDTNRDCPDGADEAACSCPPENFKCAHSDTCLEPNLYCDGDVDCDDGSDEPAGCGPPVAAGPTGPTGPGGPAA
ncbi:low-density lipoprotein receptor-like, partial [Achroia grisella]|uniref:low-density lipoprotein receptor-like n=1 Tax=Achroia grisella TaxID=688607 RepID=UPI0027D2137D